MKPRVVFDCMIFLQAAASNTGPAAACVDAADGGPVELCLSDAIAAEIRGVLDRPQIRKKFRTLTPTRVADFLTRLERVAVFVPDVAEAFTLTRDPKDSKYLNLAIAAAAKLIVSRDNDLLDLMTGTDADAELFRTAYPNIAILDPVAFLRTLRPALPTPPTDPGSPTEAP